MTNTLCRLLNQAGYDSQLYSSHSFRIGATTSSAAAGLPPWLIKTLCRWNTVQLTTKFTLACTIHACVYQFYSRDQSELACHCTKVIPRALHSSHTSSATRESDMAYCTRVRLCILLSSQTSCAARESDFVCCMRVIVRSYTMYVSLQTEYQTRE